MTGDLSACKSKQTLIQLLTINKGLALFLLHHGQVHASTRASHGAREIAGELLLELVPLVDRLLLE
jgi:hypothetical protein